jgi:uncharacterized hydrophobic protein (TIGR00341 family)
MTLRLVRLVLKEECREEALSILEEHDVSTRWVLPGSDGLVVIEMVLPREGNEPILDSLEDRFRDRESFRLLFVPLQAVVPRMEEPEEREEDDHEDHEPETSESEKESRVPARINREELYADLRDSSKTTPYYLVMVALSAVVACAGLRLGDGAVIIGAMVIAPLIGPNLGVAFATTLGDLKLGREALWASTAGALTAFGVALLAGIFFGVDPDGTEVVSRTSLTYDNLALALAAGAAGAISLTRGVGTGLVGVMVAVALLPPLANAGLLLGGGYGQMGGGALLLVLGNVVCINLAATAAFLIQGVRPNTWWDEGTRKRAVWAASILWTLLFLGLVVVIWLTWDAEASPGIFR